MREKEEIDHELGKHHESIFDTKVPSTTKSTRGKGGNDLWDDILREGQKESICRGDEPI